MTSPVARFAGAVTVVAVLGGIEALVFEMRGVTPGSTTGVLLGGFLGLISLALETGMIERSSRTFHAQGVQTTFLSFLMRLAVVAPLTLLFSKTEVGIDHEAFALSYCGTFLLYLCWLTWHTYHAPVRYRPQATFKRVKVIDRRSPRHPADLPTTLRNIW